MPTRKRILIGALALLAASAAPAAILEYSLDRMVSDCESIVEGRVLSLESRWLEGPGSIIVTDVEFVVDDVMAGAVSKAAPLRFYVIGGVVDGLGMRQEHQPVFSVGERSVLFLWTQPDERRTAVFNDEQGRYRVVADAVVNFKQQAIPLSEFRRDLEQSIRMHKR